MKKQYEKVEVKVTIFEKAIVITDLSWGQTGGSDNESESDGYGGGSNNSGNNGGGLW